MKLQFKSILEHCVDRQMRQIKSNPQYLSEKVTATILWGSVIYVPLSIMSILLQKHNPYIIFPAIIVYCSYYFLSYDGKVKTNLINDHKQTCGTLEPVDAEYEITDNSLIFRRDGNEIHSSWNNLIDLHESETDIQLTFKGGIMGIFHYEIFPNIETKENWMQILKTKWEKH